MMISRRILGVVLLATASALVACDDDSVTGPGFTCDVTNPVKDLLVRSSLSTIFVHSPVLASDTAQVGAIATNRLGDVRTDVPLNYKSSDTTVAVVDDQGVVQGRRPGTARITVSACGKSSSTQVTVVASVARVVITPASDTVVAGDSASVVARAFAPDGSRVQNVKFAFSSSSASVIAVQTSDSTASFATSSAGTATLTATGEGTAGTASLLILPRIFLAGTAASNTIDVGDSYACGLISLGHGYCWGLSNYGQLAAATDSTCFSGIDTEVVQGDSVVAADKPCSLAPLRISSEIDFATISAGDSTGCAVSVAGRAYCWGSGLFGQIGNGHTGSVTTPTLVTSALTFTSVSAGGTHACGIAAGVGYCWGHDDFGQLGDARRINSTTPIPVVTGAGPMSFASISAGFRHTCGIASDGTAYCWGNNEFGQLGNGTNSVSEMPTAVAGGLRFAMISSGGDHTCGVSTTGTAYCWGDNAFGQLGIGSTGGGSTVPVAVAGVPAMARISASSGSRALDPASGGFIKPNGRGHTCGLTTAGAVFCWGDDTDLQLGRGQFTGGGGVSGTPQVVATGERPAAATFTSVSTGSQSSCAVASDGNAYCWGSNVFGGLGNTLQAAYRGQPQRVATPR
jgi:alpha-tubulin suppressor-like RCC1 family protein